MSSNDQIINIDDDLPEQDIFINYSVGAFIVSAGLVIILGLCGWFICGRRGKNIAPITRSMIEKGVVTPSEIIDAGLVSPSAASEAAALFKYDTGSTAESIGGTPLTIKGEETNPTEQKIVIDQTIQTKTVTYPPQQPPKPKSLTTNIVTKTITTTKRSPSGSSMISYFFNPPSLSKTTKGSPSSYNQLSNLMAPLPKKR